MMQRTGLFASGLLGGMLTLPCLAQVPTLDVNGDGTLDILIIGTTLSIQNNFEQFSPEQIALELNSILQQDNSLGLSVNVAHENIFRSKSLITGIAGQYSLNRNYYCHSLAQYYYWPENRSVRLANLKGLAGVDWDHVVIGADPFIVSTMPGFHAFGVQQVARTVHEGGGIPHLLVEWVRDTALTAHFADVAYRTGQGADVPLHVVPAGSAWNALPPALHDSAAVHPTMNGAYLAAATIYSHLTHRNASHSAYVFNDAIASVADSVVRHAPWQTHFVGVPNYVSPFTACGVSDSALIYNQGGTSTEYGFLNGLNWVVAANQKTLQFSATAPIHFNYGRSSMGTTHLYNVDPSLFDHSFGYPLQDDASTGLQTMLYGIDKRRNTGDVETDLGTARQMINQGELPYARTVPLRTLIARLMEEVPGIDIYAPGDPWHLSSDVNITVGSFMHTVLTGDCTIPPAPLVCADSVAWRTWMAHKVGRETAWNMMMLQANDPCNKTIDQVSACAPFVWTDGITYTSSNQSAIYAAPGSTVCDPMTILDLTVVPPLDTTVLVSDPTLTAALQGLAYQWIDCATSAPISGATDPTFHPSGNGSYAVVISANGCSDTSSCHTVISTDLGALSFGDAWGVYPNPMEEVLNIRYPPVPGGATVVIRNVLGQEVARIQHAGSGTLRIPVRELAGTYFVEILSGQERKVFRVVKQ